MALRPMTRADCLDGPRPCPWVSCRYHLFWARRKRAKPPWEMDETCTLDIADRGGVTLDVVAAVMGLTRERVRQIEAHAIQHAHDVVTFCHMEAQMVELLESLDSIVQLRWVDEAGLYDAAVGDDELSDLDR